MIASPVSGPILRCVGCLLLVAAVPATAAAGEESSDGSLPGFVDLARCDLEVRQSTVVDNLVLTSGANLKAEGKGTRLVVLTVAGATSVPGQLPLNPRLFSANYTVEGHVMLALARALGVRLERESREVWTDSPGNALVFTMDEVGDEFQFMLAFELPAATRTVHLCVPALMEESVTLVE